MYFEENFINNIGTKTEARRQRRLMNMDIFLNEQSIRERSLNALKDNKQEVFLKEVNSNFESKIENTDYLLTESAVNIENGVNETFKSFLVECVIDGLNIDPAVVELNRTAIVEKVESFYDAVAADLHLENNIITEAINKCIKSVNECMSSEETFELLEAESNYISSAIKSKVEKVMQEETDFAGIEVMKESDDSLSSVETSLTLFKEMQILNVKNILTEGCEEEHSKEDIMNAALYETVVEYTMVEMFNTMEMLHFHEDVYSARNRRKKLRFVL